MSIRRWKQFDFSGGVQQATSWLLAQPNELSASENAVFGEEIGTVIRRPGYTSNGSTFATNKTPTGFHVAKFSTGSERLVAVNDSGDTETKVMYQDSNGDWQDLITGQFSADCQVFFHDYMDHVFVSGYDSNGDPITPHTIDSSLTTSTTLHLQNAPSPHYFVEYGGRLYAVNVDVDSTRYVDRAYRSSLPLGAVTYVRGDVDDTVTEIAVDSVKWLKVGMDIDIYTKETDTKVADITITGINKDDKKIEFSSQALTLGDNDEIWLDGRKGERTLLWNTDWPTPEKADWIDIQPGADSNNYITGAAKSNNRLFLFTRNSGTKFDGANRVTFNSTIGCISHRSIQNIDDDWLIWLDANGRVRARNDSTGQQEDISRAIRSNIMNELTLTNMENSSAVSHDNKYKLFVGTVDGKIRRITYDFDSNTWEPERHLRDITLQAVDEYNGRLRPFFVSDNGQMYVDEVGTTDDGSIIPFEVETVRSNYGSEQIKRYAGIHIYSQYAHGLKVYCSVNNGQYKVVGQITDDDQYIDIARSSSIQDSIKPGSSVRWKIAGSVGGERHRIEGITAYNRVEEEIPRVSG